MTPPTSPGLHLYWIPLGAGTHVVRISGSIYEAFSALVQRRRRGELYHSALVAVTADGRYVVEMTPVPDLGGREQRGVVAQGPVGARRAAGFRVFRYEIRCWREGVIPDISFAVDSPIQVTDDHVVAQRFLELVPHVPTPVWGRDELRTGEMWNSNSVTSWLLARLGLVEAAGRPPGAGRAPGWQAGLVAARRGAPTAMDAV